MIHFKNIAKIGWIAIAAISISVIPAGAKTKTVWAAETATRFLPIPRPEKLILKPIIRVYENLGCQAGRLIATEQYGMAGDPGPCRIR